MADMREIITDLKKRNDEQKIQIEQLYSSYTKAIQEKDEYGKKLGEDIEKVSYT